MTGDGLERVGFMLLDGFSDAGGVGSSGDFQTGAVYGWARVDCLTCVAFDGLGGGIGHVLVGIGVISSSVVLSG